MCAPVCMCVCQCKCRLVLVRGKCSQLQLKELVPLGGTGIPRPPCCVPGETESHRGVDMCPAKVIPQVSSSIGKRAQSPASLKPGLRKRALWIVGRGALRERLGHSGSKWQGSTWRPCWCCWGSQSPEIIPCIL
ncbi:hypothetical protein HJG60_011133 [Phyllostomus discolor]|uniref:Uncharacterized protein n=1 Tax=Phyllostomus discolor TaxID=89673 RepID=A0A834A3W5_9CHIR|nr:hypothetical protein HJG60_011133 [Phyllostomus discolor]